jgi:hypothetical protein
MRSTEPAHWLAQTTRCSSIRTLGPVPVSTSTAIRFKTIWPDRRHFSAVGDRRATVADCVGGADITHWGVLLTSAGQPGDATRCRELASPPT